MKPAFIFCLLLLSVRAMAQADTTFTPPPDSTAIGAADGNPVSKEIGPAGGTIVSDDGKMELIFPSGALTANTVISIQPTINLAPSGNGKSYQCEPSGIQFKKPVQIIFHYTAEEEEESPPELMGLAMQDDKGKWSFIQYDDWDSTARTLKGSIHHFTTFTRVNNLQLYPERPLVLAGKSVQLYLLDLAAKYSEPPKYGAEYANAIVDRDAPRLWYVNGFENGNPSVGTVQPYEYKLFGNGYGVLARYYAPKYMLPKKVTIQVDVYVRSRDPKVYYRKRKVFCKVEIYDVYTVEIKGEFNLRLGMDSKISDHADFLLFLYPNSMDIDRIKNYEPVVQKEGRRGPFREEVAVKGALGSINITHVVKRFEITTSFPPEVSIEFLTTQLVWCAARYSARGIKGEWQQVTGRSEPGEIKFIANRERQDIPVDKGEIGKYHIIVMPFGY